MVLAVESDTKVEELAKKKKSGEIREKIYVLKNNFEEKRFGEEGKL